MGKWKADVYLFIEYSNPLASEFGISNMNGIMGASYSHVKNTGTLFFVQ